MPQGRGWIITAIIVLVTSLSSVCMDYVGQSVEGEVEEGNYTYYTLRQMGNVRIVLTSLEGDADLYVAFGEKEKPTYMFDSHYMNSATCGVDVLSLTHHMKRPVHIGVYGYPRHKLSKYVLDVVIVESEEFDPFSVESEGEDGGLGETGRKSHGEGKYRNSDKEDESDFWSDEQGLVKMIFTSLRLILEIVLDIMI